MCREQLSLGEMPPKNAKQLSVEQKRQLTSLGASDAP